MKSKRKVISSSNFLTVLTGFSCAALRLCTTCCWCPRWRRQRSLRSVWSTGTTWQPSCTGRVPSPPPARRCCPTCHLADTFTCLYCPRYDTHTQTYSTTVFYCLQNYFHIKMLSSCETFRIVSELDVCSVRLTDRLFLYLLLFLL